MESKSSSNKPAAGGCCGPTCGCGPQASHNNSSNSTNATGPSRRRFVQGAAAGAAGLFAGSLNRRVMAGPFDPTDAQSLIPADKKLHPDWVRSLYARGAPAVYRGDQLKWIGLPIGGIGCGQLYLAGDGTLWHWDIFNKHIGTGAGHYANPMNPDDPAERRVAQGFALRLTADGKTQTRRLDKSGFADVAFRGEYPVGRVEYHDPASPAAVTLEAFSPFIPLNAPDSALPATILRYTIRNTSTAPLTCDLAGHLANAVGIDNGAAAQLARRNRITHRDGALMLECTATVPAPPKIMRSDILFDDFEKPDYAGWTVTGKAFGAGPIELTKVPSYQGDLHAAGKRAVNSHASAPGNDVAAKDSATGTLTSKAFTINRRFITFLLGGGHNPGKTCVNLLVDGKVARTVTGHNSNAMQPAVLNVTDLEGKSAQLQIVDNVTGPWGNIGVDQIVFTDQPAESGPGGDPTRLPDFGSMTLALLHTAPTDRAAAHLPLADLPDSAFADHDDNADATAPIGGDLIGSLTRSLTLKPGESQTVDFVLAWHFSNLVMDRLPGGRHYANRFDSAPAVAGYISKNFDRLSADTRRWRDTWYDSTLPYWLLDRVATNASIPATSMAFWFANGRFYGWEGVGCCPGTCTHVWHYAQALGRLFPELERSVREMVDFKPGVGFDAASGAIGMRAEFDRTDAIDGHAGSVLRAYREHQMSVDAGFLNRNWPNIRRAIGWLMGQDAADGKADGIVTVAQHNTLDAAWFGPISWISSLYLAALRAGEAMAREMGDDAFADRAHTVFTAGAANITPRLFYKDEYYIQIRDKDHPKAVGAGIGCEIDQVFGQNWAFQVGLPDRVLPRQQTVTALQSLWKYNFAPDAGAYHKAKKAGRWYAMPGEAGLLMCTFPHGGEAEARGQGNGAWSAMYFNECMNGFEHQAAAHMIWEGLLEHGLAVERALHDRYDPQRRNPYNEVECGDHYARSMASYGVFLALCGYEHHGPLARLGFDPRITPDDFKAPFTAAGAWGSFTQQRTQTSHHAAIDIHHGSLRLQTFTLTPHAAFTPKSVTAKINDHPTPAKISTHAGRTTITFDPPIDLPADQSLTIELT